METTKLLCRMPMFGDGVGWVGEEETSSPCDSDEEREKKRKGKNEE